MDYVDDFEKREQRNNLKPMWDKRMKRVDLEEPTLLLYQVYWECTPRECNPNTKIAQENKDLLESLIPAGTIKQLLGWEKSHADTIAWS